MTQFPDDTREARRGLQMVNGSRLTERKPKALPSTSSAQMGASFNGWPTAPFRGGRAMDNGFYYTSSRLQRVYRVSRTGGDPQEIRGTADGSVAGESSDGWIYYSGHPGYLGTWLRRTPSRGGEATDVFPEQVAGRNFVVTEAGIWYMTPAQPQRKAA